MYRSFCHLLLAMVALVVLSAQASVGSTLGALNTQKHSTLRMDVQNFRQEHDRWAQRKRDGELLEQAMFQKKGALRRIEQANVHVHAGQPQAE